MGLKRGRVFFVMLVICSLKFSFTSKITPRNFAELERPIVVLSNLMGLREQFLFHVNMTIFVFSVLLKRSSVDTILLSCI